MNSNQVPRLDRRAAAVYGTIFAALLAGCGSAAAPTHFHTLMPPPVTPANRAAAGQQLDWQVLPVAVPIQVDQPQWVLRVADGSLVVLEQERWIAPLADEIHAAVVEQLTQTLGPPAPVHAGAQWLVVIEVRRFDLVAGSEARLEATWSIRDDKATGTALSCAVRFSQPPTATGYPPLAAAQRQAVAALGDAIGKALRAAAKGQDAAC